jgi:hypothetical protein
MFFNIASAEIVNPLEDVTHIVVATTAQNPAVDRLLKILNKADPSKVTAMKIADGYRVAYERTALDIDSEFKFYTATRGKFFVKGKRLGEHVPMLAIEFKILDGIMVCW